MRTDDRAFQTSSHSGIRPKRVVRPARTISAILLAGLWMGLVGGNLCCAAPSSRPVPGSSPSTSPKPGTGSAESQEQPLPEISPFPSLQLRTRFTEFAESELTRLNEVEDRWTTEERTFQDQIRKELRAFDLKAIQDLNLSSDWKLKKRESRDERRRIARELNQKVRLHKEQKELELLQLQHMHEKMLKTFFDEIETSLKRFAAPSSSPSSSLNNSEVKKAEQDYKEEREELKQSVKHWIATLRNSRTKENFWE